MHTNDYRIQKERLAVVLTTVSGDRLDGDVFVQPSARNRIGREDVTDVVNSAEPFFPLVTGGGATYLIAKDQVREVHAEQHEDVNEDEWRIGEPVTVEVVLSGGSCHRGTLYLESLTGFARVIDYLNRATERFLTLYTATGPVLVNRTMIERVRPVD
jgi:hypothetical protein